MSYYLCKLGTSDGRVLEREYQSRDADELSQALAEQGFFVFSVRRKWFTFGQIGGVKELKGDRLLSFNQELLVLMRSGLPVIKIFDTLLKRQEKGWFRELLIEIREGIKGGASLSEAFGSVSGSFPYLYIAMISAGERTGDLVETLGRFHEYQKKVEYIRRKFQSAAVYPSILLFALSAMLLIMILYVIPNFSKMYADSGADLPYFTKMLVGFSTGVLNFLPILIPMFFIMLFLIRRSFSVRKVRERRDKLLIRLPMIGTLLIEYALSRFLRTLGTIVKSGTPLVEAMQMARGTLNNLYLESKITHSTRMVNEGGGFAESIATTGIIPSVAMGMIDAGETAGALDDILVEVADYYDLQVEARVDGLTHSVEPIILLIVGVIIAGVLVGMYLPIFQLAGTAG